MRKNSNGFTLVELIAVVVILGLIGLIVTPAVIGVIRGAEADVKDVNMDTILNAAYDLAQKDPSILPIRNGRGGQACVTELVNCGLLKSDIYTEVEDSANAYFEVVYCSETSETGTCTKEPSLGKYFGNYLFLYKEDGNKTCDRQVACRFKALPEESN